MPRHLPKLLLAALVVYWAAMFVATHIPGDALPDEPRGFDKLAHFAAYAALAWLAALVLYAKGWLNWKSVVAIFLVGAIYGAVDEWLQPYFDRDASVADWCADLAGIVFGLIAFQFTATLLRRRSRDRAAATAPRPPAAS